MKAVTLGQRCPRCKGELMQLSYTDPIDFNMKTINKIVCTKCSAVYKQEELNQVMTEEVTTTSTTTSTPIQTQDTELPNGAMMGWICPKCGAVMSPFQSYCVKCSGNWEFTWSTGAPYNIPTNSECNGGNK